MTEKSRLKTRVALTTAIIILAVLVCTTVVSGYTATKALPVGSYILSGEDLSINLIGLTAGDQVNLSFAATRIRNTTNPSIQATSFAMPFAGVSGTSWTNATSTNVKQLTLKVTEQDGTIYLYDNTTIPDPKIFGRRDIKKETYQLIKLSGEPAVVGTDVSLTLWMNGTVTGTPNDPANLRFTLQGVSSGEFVVGVYNANTLVSSWSFSIALPPSPPPDYNVGSDGGAAPAGPAAAPGAAVAPSTQQVTMLIAQEGQTLATYTVSTPTAATVDASVTVPQGTTITDLSGNFVNSMSISQVSVEDVPSMPEGAGFAFGGYAVQCGPEGVTFSQPASLTFSLTQDQWDAALAQAGGNPALMEVQFYDKATQSWVGVTTTVNTATHEVTALVDHFSLFALVIIQAPMETPVAEVPTGEAVPPGLTTEPTIILAIPPTTPKPTPTPFVSVPAMIGVLAVAGLAYSLARKR